MSKIKYGFLAIIFIISIAAVIALKMYIYKTPLAKTGEKVPDFIITQVSGSGLYVNKDPIKRSEISLAQKADIKQMQYVDDLYAATDRNTAFEFYYAGTSFIVQPDSFLYYQPKTKKLHFLEGEFLWHKEIADNNVEISIEPLKLSSSKDITLSREGKIFVTSSGARIWNYAGVSKFNDGSEPLSLNPNTYLTYASNQKTSIAFILEAPAFISPEEKSIIMNQPGDSTVKFNWKEVTGAQRYIFRLYSSKLMENILYEKQVTTNWVNLDLLQFEDSGTFYWQVCAYDSLNDREGTPSKIGNLTMSGALFNRQSALKPPELTIKTLDVNGNLVLIEGTTDKNSQLYINNTPVTLNPEGTFIHTIHFTNIGKYKITFKVISALGSETTIEKFATIYDE